MLPLLLACVAEKPPTETAPPDAWEPPVVPCDGAVMRPVTVDDLVDFWPLYGPDRISLVPPRQHFASYERDWGCPTSTTAGDTTTWEGDCAYDGFAWSGRWTDTWTAGDAFPSEIVAEDVRYFDDHTGYHVALDGRSAWEVDASGVEVTERDFTLSWSGYPFEWITGDWTVTAFERFVPDTVYTAELHIDAVPTEGPAGTWCIVSESYPSAGCDAEAGGGWVLQGDRTLVVRRDPDVACDGCGAVTIDGEPAGEYCGGGFGYLP